MFLLLTLSKYTPAGFSATEAADYNCSFLFSVSLFTIITVEPRCWSSFSVKPQVGLQVMLLKIKSSYLDANQRLSLKCRWVLRHLTLYEKFIDCKSRYPEVFCEKGVLKSFAKFTGKYQYWQSCRPEVCKLIKMRFQHMCFLVNFAKFLRKATVFCRRYVNGCFSRSPCVSVNILYEFLYSCGQTENYNTFLDQALFKITQKHVPSK